MPRKAEPARLYERKARRGRKAVFVIRDGKYEESTRTGCRAEAEAHLAQYLIEKGRPAPAVSGDEFEVNDALIHYAESQAPETADPERIGYAIDALVSFWGGKSLSDVTKASCNLYAGFRREVPEGSKRKPIQDGTIRRELGTLRAAINLAKEDGLTTASPIVFLPPKPTPKEVWITRSEAATLIRIARRSKKTKHLARFILMALYTGSRKTVILRLKFKKHSKGGWVDTKNGVLYRKAEKARVTRKRAPSVRIPLKLLGHLKRWEKISNHSVVEFKGAQVGSIKSSWNTLLRTALEEEKALVEANKEAKKKDREEFEVKTGFADKHVTPRSLRHTAITWAMLASADLQQSCGFFGVSWETMQEVYIHHHPDHQKDVADAVNKGGRK